MSTLRISCPADNWSERSYIIHILFNEFLGLTYQLEPDPDLSDYRIVFENGNEIIIWDHFFSKYKKDLDYLSIENLPQKIGYYSGQFAPVKDIPVLYGDSEVMIEQKDGASVRIQCGIDIFASAYFMLSRWEEYVSTEKDHLHRSSARSSFAYEHQFLSRPVVNEYNELLWNMIIYADHQQSRRKREFSALLTHDVDFVLRWYNVFNIIKALMGDLLKRRSLKAFFSNTQDFILTKLGIRKDPFNTYDYLMTLSEQRGLQSHFFFMSFKKQKQLFNYRLTHPFVRKLMWEIDDRKHMIGFHPDFNSFRNPGQWKREHQRLDAIAPQKIKCGRQHYLQFEVPGTWQLWEDMGMEWDSSLTYDDEPGFRTGTCYNYSVYNFLTRKKLNLIEKPLIIMDKSLVFHHQELDQEGLLGMARDLIDQVKKYNGEFVILWHNNCFNAREWEPYKGLYPSILDSL